MRKRHQQGANEVANWTVAVPASCSSSICFNRASAFCAAPNMKNKNGR